MKHPIKPGCRLLYVGDGQSGTTSADRIGSLRRLGFEVTVVNTASAPGRIWKADAKFSRRWQVGFQVAKTNQELDARLSTSSWDILWIDKGWNVWPRLVEKAKKARTVTVLFNNDNPWSRLEEGLWRHLLQSLRHFDTVMAPRLSSADYYRAHGTTQHVFVEFGFDPIRHTPGKSQNAVKLITFIGTPHQDGMGLRPDRAIFLRDLSRRFPKQISIFGHGWSQLKAQDLAAFAEVGGPKNGSAYADGIRGSLANFSFITHANHDVSSHKAFEIAACGGLLVAERSNRMTELFRPDKEALFFSSLDEASSLVERILKGDIDREGVSAAARARCLADGYDNDSLLLKAVHEAVSLRGFVA